LLKLTRGALLARALALVGVSDDQSPVLAHPDNTAIIMIAAYFHNIRIDLSMHE
jgi:hypothetical protein